MSYSAIANSEIDASSPLTETLMTKIRDNIEGHNHSEATTTDIVTAGIADAAVTGVKTSKTIATSGTQNIGGSGTWVPAAGIYQVIVDTSSSADIIFEMYAGGSWRSGSVVVTGIYYCDGTNMRFANESVSQRTIYYQTF